jgi:hypothetical protein
VTLFQQNLDELRVSLARLSLIYPEERGISTIINLALSRGNISRQQRDKLFYTTKRMTNEDWKEMREWFDKIRSTQTP